MRPIDAEAFQKFIKKQDESPDYTIYHFEEWLEQQPTIEVVPKELYEQILWERNIAMEQLEEHGIGFAAKKKNEVEAKPVVHAHWEYHGGDDDMELYGFCSHCRKGRLTEDDILRLKPLLCPYCGAQIDEFAGDINVGTKKE